MNPANSVKLVPDRFWNGTTAENTCCGGYCNRAHETALEISSTNLTIMIGKVFEQHRTVSIDNGLQQGMMEEYVLSLRYIGNYMSKITHTQ